MTNLYDSLLRRITNRIVVSGAWLTMSTNAYASSSWSDRTNSADFTRIMIDKGGKQAIACSIATCSEITIFWPLSLNLVETEAFWTFRQSSGTKIAENWFWEKLQTDSMKTNRLKFARLVVGLILASTWPGTAMPQGAAGTLRIYPAIELEFSTALGCNYQIESSSNLVDWATFGTPVAGTGSNYNLLVSTKNTERRFYRLRPSDLSGGLVAFYRFDGDATDSSGKLQSWRRLQCHAGDEPFRQARRGVLLRRKQ